MRIFLLALLLSKLPGCRSLLCLASALLCFPAFVRAEDTGTSTNNLEPSFWARHLNILKVEQITRFNYMDREPYAVLSRDVQYRIRTRGQWKLTESGSTYIEMRAENGKGFDNSWNNLGIGKSSPQGYLTMKSLFIGQHVGSHVELQAGGIEFEQGAGSQRSYASADGVMDGYRLILDRVQSRLGFEKVSVTAGFVGDFEDVNVFRSFKTDLNQVNYLQLTATRNLGEKGEFSGEMNSIRGIWFTREALHLKAPLPRVLDDVQLEIIARTSNNPRIGYAAFLSRFFDTKQRLRNSVIFTDLPYSLFQKNNQAILLPQGEIEAGKRFSFGSSYALSKNLQVSIFGGRLLDATPAKRYVAQVAVGYDYTSILSHLLH